MKVKLNNAEIELSEEQRQDLLKQLNQVDVEDLVKKELLEWLEKYKSNIIFLNNEGYESKYPTPHFKILNDESLWLFDINYDKENKEFWYSYNYVYKVFDIKYNIKLDAFQEVMQSVLNEYLNLNGVTTVDYY